MAIFNLRLQKRILRPESPLVTFVRHPVDIQFRWLQQLICDHTSVICLAPGVGDFQQSLNSLDLSISSVAETNGYYQYTVLQFRVVRLAGAWYLRHDLGMSRWQAREAFLCKQVNLFASDHPLH